MAVLIAFAAVLCACYSPEIRDCALACSSPDDCAGGQACGADHLCAAPDTHCSADGGTSADARVPADAARVAIDAGHPPPDASIYILIHVHVDGSGAVTIAPCDVACTCDSTLGPPDCMVHARAGVQSTAAAAGRGNQQFAMWNGAPCMGQPATCVFTPMPTSLVSVKFQKPN